MVVHVANSTTQLYIETEHASPTFRVILADAGTLEGMGVFIQQPKESAPLVVGHETMSAHLVNCSSLENCLAHCVDLSERYWRRMLATSTCTELFDLPNLTWIIE